MSKLILKMIFMFFAVVSTSIYAQDLSKPFRDLIQGGQSSDQNEIGVLQSQTSTGDISIKNCQYRTQKGFDFSVNIRIGTCPRTVYINVQTMQIQVPNY